MRVGALGAFLAVVAAFVGAPAYVDGLQPREKAALLVVSGLPAPPRVGGVILFEADRNAPRPRRALVYTDQEGGVVKRFPGLPPFQAAAGYRTRAACVRGGQADGSSTAEGGRRRRSGAGPGCARRAARLAAFRAPGARGRVRRGGSLAGGVGACAKHFPGLGSTAVTTDSRQPVTGIVRASEVAGFRQAVRAGIPCVMVGHAIYVRFGSRPASLSRGAYGSCASWASTVSRSPTSSVSSARMRPGSPAGRYRQERISSCSRAPTQRGARSGRCSRQRGGERSTSTSGGFSPSARSTARDHAGGRDRYSENHGRRASRSLRRHVSRPPGRRRRPQAPSRRDALARGAGGARPLAAALCRGARASPSAASSSVRSGSASRPAASCSVAGAAPDAVTRVA